MNIGNLNKRIEIQSSTETSDGIGGVSAGFATTHTVWAAIWPVSATDTVAANAISMINTHKIRIRYLSDISTSDRIKFGDRYFAITSIINPNEANKMLDLVCKEVA